MNTKNNFITKEMFDKYKQEQKNKFRRFIVFVVVLCLIISGITGVASYSLAATQVGYTPKDTSWTVQNTGDAIDELRDSVGASLVGSIFSYMGTTAPYGYLACDGTEYNIADYPRLASHINAHFGSINHFGGDGTTTFAVPDLRGEFLRGTGTNSHSEQGSGANVGEHQNGTKIFNIEMGRVDALTSQWGTTYYNSEYDYTIPGDSAYKNYYYRSGYESNVASYTKYYTSRPTNTSVLYIIKY